MSTKRNMLIAQLRALSLAIKLVNAKLRSDLINRIVICCCLPIECYVKCGGKKANVGEDSSVRKVFLFVDFTVTSGLNKWIFKIFRG